MTQLSCSADSCGHNKDGYCCLNHIDIAGEKAMESMATCCGSFVEQSGAFTNDTSLPAPYSDIDCSAHKCMYNLNGHCEADNVDISGHAAVDPEETLCSTFVTNE